MEAAPNQLASPPFLKVKWLLIVLFTVIVSSGITYLILANNYKTTYNTHMSRYQSLYQQYQSLLNKPSSIVSPPVIQAQNLLIFSVPQSWNIDNRRTSDYLYLNSPDLEQGFPVLSSVGAIIMVNKAKTEEKQITCDPNEEQEFASDITCTMIDGKPAKKYHNDYESHALVYETVYNDYSYSFSLQTMDLNSEKKYLTDFEGFIKSIEFLTPSRLTF